MANNYIISLVSNHVKNYPRTIQTSDFHDKEQMHSNVAAESLEYICSTPHTPWYVKENYWRIKLIKTFIQYPTNEIRPSFNSRQQLSLDRQDYRAQLHDLSGISSPGWPNIRRLRSIDATAKYFESGPNFTHVDFPGNKWFKLHLNNCTKNKY